MGNSNIYIIKLLYKDRKTDNLYKKTLASVSADIVWWQHCHVNFNFLKPAIHKYQTNMVDRDPFASKKSG